MRRPSLPIRRASNPGGTTGPANAGYRLPLDDAVSYPVDRGYLVDPDDLTVWTTLPPPPTLTASWHVLDAWDALWEIEEVRATEHGFPVVLGRPASGGPHGMTTVMTPPLMAYLTRHRRDPGRIRLPVGRGVVQRLRKLLGHNWYEDGERWWLEREADLRALTVADFCARHAVQPAAFYAARRALVGPGQRAAGWWRDPALATLILAHQPRAIVGAGLGVSATSIGKMRADLRRKAGEEMTPAAVAHRVSIGKAGLPLARRPKPAP